MGALMVGNKRLSTHILGGGAGLEILFPDQVWLWDACAQGSRFSCRLPQSNQQDNNDEARERSDCYVAKLRSE